MPVVENNSSNLTDSSVNQDCSRCHFLFMSNAVFGDFNHIPVIGNHTVFRGNTHQLRQCRMLYKHTVFSVDRDKELGLDECEHKLQIFPRSMAGNMEIRMAVINYLGTTAIKLVNDTGDHVLITRNGRGRDNHKIPGINLDLFVFGKCHTI